MRKSKSVSLFNNVYFREGDLYVGIAAHGSPVDSKLLILLNRLWYSSMMKYFGGDRSRTDL
jgi:hypothetical protein